MQESSCTYSGQPQVNLWFSGRRASVRWRDCGRRKTTTGQKPDQNADAGQQHDMHFTDLSRQGREQTGF